MFMKLEKAIFSTVFLLLLFLPLFLADRRENTVSAAERRSLAAPARYYREDGTRNPNYLADVETWYNDHLGLRDLMVKANGKLKYYVFGKLNSMRLGAHGELAPFFSRLDYQHRNLFSEEEVRAVTEAYQSLFECLDAQGVQVYYMQCWDKHSIYPEQYTDTLQVFGDVSRTDQIEQALISGTGMDVVPIKDRMISLKDRYTLYGTWADPWHWVPRGAFVGYTELIREINARNNGKYRELTEADFNIEIRDIGWNYYGGIHRVDEEEVFELKESHCCILPEKLIYLPEAGHLQHATYFENHSVDNEDTLLIVGDSYFHDFHVMDYLAESFHTTILFNGDSMTCDTLLKIFAAYKPDLVVIENAERCNYRFEEIMAVTDDLQRRRYPMGEEIHFCREGITSDEYPSENYILSGFSPKEDGFTRTSGKEANLFFYADGFEPGKRTTLRIDVKEIFGDTQSVKILLNRACIYDAELTSAGTLEADFPMPDTQMLSLTILLEDAVSPFETGADTDLRELALQITGLQIVQ
ncbi:MAG: hypothetical protein K6E92_08240 [Lachnospiraceae bacterium]|nr:hypothetical protein [Lachnospiraceae bacterium]